MSIKNGILTLFTKDQVVVAKGKAISNYLYHMDITTQKPDSPQFKNITVTLQTFIANEPAMSWETWH